MGLLNEEIVKQILELRAENGLEASEAAIYADLEKSKAKWTVDDTPRYRRAGRSPIYISGKYLSSYGIDPATGEKDGREKASKRTSSDRPPATPTKVDEEQFLKVLHGKGFKVRVSRNLITGEIDREIPAAIEKLSLAFGAIPNNAAGVHVIQTSPQIQVAMPLDRFLELAGIKP